MRLFQTWLHKLKTSLKLLSYSLQTSMFEPTELNFILPELVKLQQTRTKQARAS